MSSKTDKTTKDSLANAKKILGKKNDAETEGALSAIGYFCITKYNKEGYIYVVKPEFLDKVDPDHFDRIKL